MKPFLLLGNLLVIFSSLKGQGHAYFEKALIIDSVRCLQDPEQSYALYLPEEYGPEESWPILYIFDPAGRGTHALEQFQPAAERFNVILACSNNSRNGSWDDVFEAADAVFLDTQERFAVDKERVYLAGFSGGSRAALAMAVLTPEIAGVIGCGAALPPVKAYQPSAETASFLYVGMAGLRDMNYLEHLDAARSFDTLGIDNYLIHFEVGHEWPPSEDISLAVHWLELKYQERRGDVSPALLASFRDSVLARGRAYYREGYPALAVAALERYKERFSRAAPGKVVDSLLLAIRQGRPYRKALKRHQKTNHRERILKDRYLAAFVELYLTGLSEEKRQWWQEEIGRLRSRANRAGSIRSNSAHRLLNLISARSAESCIRYTSEGQYSIALALNEIWLEASPESAYPFWHMAKINALMGRKAAALDFLERALDKGMQRKKSLFIPAFEELQPQARFQELLRRMEGAKGPSAG